MTQRRVKLYTFNAESGMIKANCYIGIIHLAGAYYIVTLTAFDQKYLTFPFDLLWC